MRRIYRYVVDHLGLVHHSSPGKEPSIATAQRDAKFLDDLYRGLRRRKDGSWSMVCQGEMNVLSSTTDDVIVVFHSLLEEERRLMFAGTFWEQFEPGKLVCCETSGRLFHPLDKYSSAFGRFGLVGGGVASDHLAERLVYDGDQVLLEWNKERHVVRKLSSLSS